VSRLGAVHHPEELGESGRLDRLFGQETLVQDRVEVVLGVGDDLGHPGQKERQHAWQTRVLARVGRVPDSVQEVQPKPLFSTLPAKFDIFIFGPLFYLINVLTFLLRSENRVCRE